MDIKKKKNFIIASICIIIFMAMTACAIILMSSASLKNSAEVFSEKNTASIYPTVTDASTGEPIQNATIVIPELNKSFITDSQGNIGRINVPVIYDNRYDNILKKPWGEISILVYADGYAPCSVLGYMVKNGVDREGPAIMLFNEGNKSQSYSLYEAPHKEWVDTLIEKYKP